MIFPAPPPSKGARSYRSAVRPRLSYKLANQRKHAGGSQTKGTDDENSREDRDFLFADRRHHQRSRFMLSVGNLPRAAAAGEAARLSRVLHDLRVSVDIQHTNERNTSAMSCCANPCGIGEDIHAQASASVGGLVKATLGALQSQVQTHLLGVMTLYRPGRPWNNTMEHSSATDVLPSLYYVKIQKR